MMRTSSPIVADVDNTGAAYGIRSDGRGVYTDVQLE